MAAPPPQATHTCLLINDVPHGYSDADIANAFAFKRAVNSLPEVTRDVFPNCNSNAWVTLSAECDVPVNVEMERGLSPNPVHVLFTESAVIWLETPNLVPQYFDVISEQAEILHVSVERIGTNTIKASGTCTQLQKLRSHVSKLLSRAFLDFPNKSPQTHTQEHFRSSQVQRISFQAGISPQPLSGAVAQAPPLSSPPPGARVISNLSCDVLLLMPKLPYIITPGVQYRPYEERVFILGKDDQNASSDAFLEAYRKVTSSVKSIEIEANAEHSKEEIKSVVIEYNQRYKQCFFAFNEQNGRMKIISTSSRQFEQAKKLLVDKFCRPSVQTIEHLKFPSGRVLTVKKADIVDEKCSAIVNAANSQLDHGGGVAGALNAASNGELQHHSNKYISHCGTVPVGDVVQTKAGGNLKCKYVFHAVGPNASSPGMDDRQCYKLIYQATTKALSMADKLKVPSIAFPALSTGIYGVSCSTSARAMLSAIEEFKCTKKDLLNDVSIVIIDAPTHSWFAQEVVLRRIRLQQNSSLPGTSVSGPDTSSSDTNSVSPLDASSTPSGASASDIISVSPLDASSTLSGAVSDTSTVSPPTASDTNTVSPLTNTVSPAVYTSDNNTVSPPAASASNTNMVSPPPGASANTIPGPGATGSQTLSQNSPLASQASLLGKPSSDFSRADSSHLQSGIQQPMGTPPPGFELNTGQNAATSKHFHASKSPSLSHRSSNNGAGKSLVAANLSNQKSNVGDQNPSNEQDKSAPSKEQPKPGPGASGLESCPICLDDKFIDPVVLNCCSKKFCRKCIDTAIAASPYCPTCKFPLRKIVGNQPHGTMSCHVEQVPLPGYKNCGTIVIDYHFSGGIQSAKHPNPGYGYGGTHRTAYLPDNKEGHEVLVLLKRAFDQLLLFTIGTSVTTGATNVVVWNDVHQKTSRHGGPYGYPDPTYLHRVKEELEAKGIY